MREVTHFLNGHDFKDSQERWGEIFDPNTGRVQAKVSLGGKGVLDRAVEGAKAAQSQWSQLNPQRRARVMFEFKRLLERDLERLAHLLSSEHGKVIADSKGDIQRGLEVVEFVCGIAHLLKGEYTDGAGPGIDVYSMRQPLGVVAGITPFNFPAMIPLWMCAPAIASGNGFILKPSERDPSVPVALARLLIEAGAPEGLMQVCHGDKEMVDAILEHPDIKAVSFVGSSEIANYVATKGAQNAKRTQCMGGAKNHALIMPDADLDQAVADILGAAFGSAGERCMALPAVVPVGEATATALRARLEKAIPTLKVGISTDPDAHFGPVVTKQHRDKVKAYIDMGVREGAELVIDGRDFSLKGYEEGFFLGPCLFDHVKAGMQSYQEEIFGPVLQMLRVEDFESAIALPSQHPYGNGTAIFTRNGHLAREFANRVEVGMVGINVPIPVPVAYHSFGGWKRSAFSDLNQYGTDSIKFFTRTKTVTQKWPSGGSVIDQSFVIPTMR